MSTKYNKTKKILIKHAIIISVTISILLGINIYISGYSDDLSGELAQKQSANDSIKSQYNNIMTKAGFSDKVVSFYNSYKLNHNAEFSINREDAKKIISELRKKHHLAESLEMTILPSTEVQGTAFKLDSGVAIKNEVTLKFGAVNDNSVYNFIEELNYTMPGIILVHSLKLKRENDLSSDYVSSSLSSHKISPLINGELSFSWIGIRPKPTDNGTGNAK